MEYVPLGDLGGLITTHGNLPEMTVKSMADQLVSALKYLHGLKITHRDIKPDNILISCHDPFQVKLTDFGLSKIIESEETFMRTFCGTLLYCAPEVYSEYREYDASGRRTLRGLDKRFLPPQRYDEAVDLWSFSAVLFYALSGSPPFPVRHGASYLELLSTIMSKPLSVLPLQNADISDNGIAFIASMLRVRPEQRPTIADLERSAWLISDEESYRYDYDEVDMIRDGSGDDLEKSASQLSIRELAEVGDNYLYDESAEVANISRTQRQIEIPSSFNTGDETSEDSYGLAPADNVGCLFGEVTASALGSSGVIQTGRLNLDATASGDLLHDRSRDYHDQGRSEAASVVYTTSEPPSTYTVMPPAPLRNTSAPPAMDSRDSHVDAGVSTAPASPSLLGAESLVGQMRMNTPPNASSPQEMQSPPPELNISVQASTSVRRRREVNEEYEADRHRIVKKPRPDPQHRQIEMEITQKYYWTEDPATHHYQYPRIMMSEAKVLRDIAREKGEFHNFDLLTSFHAATNGAYSRSPSTEPATAMDKQSTGHALNGDDRMLEVSGKLATKAAISLPGCGASAPRSAPPSVPPGAPPQSARSNRLDSIHVTADSKIPRTVASDLAAPSQPPKFAVPPAPLLAKLTSDSGSFLPNYSIRITSQLTGWGRGVKNNYRYPDPMEDRISKYSFKIVAWSPDFDAAKPWKKQGDKMSFWLTTQSTGGFRVNDVMMTSTKNGTSNFTRAEWIELRHGDVFLPFKSGNEHLRFVFECYWGISQSTRERDDKGNLVHKILDLGLEVFDADQQVKKYAEEAEKNAARESMKAQEKVLVTGHSLKGPKTFTQSFSA